MWEAVFKGTLLFLQMYFCCWSQMLVFEMLDLIILDTGDGRIMLVQKQISFIFVRFEILIAVLPRIQVSLGMTLCHWV
jgi:hypothetical protein